jgi:threonine/homoserine/homoserine lactone efflux protein
MPANLLLFCVAAFILIVTPGPNFFYVLTRGAAHGRRAGLVAACGLGAGVLIHTTLATLGVAAVVRSSYVAFRVIKYGGSLYLVYLGVRALGDRPANDTPRQVMASDARIFWQSIVASMTNPKTILFFLSFLPQFVTGPVADASAQMLRLGAIYMLLTLIVYGTLGYFAGYASRWLRVGRVRSDGVRWLTAGSFISLGVWAALPDRR